jgi:hypothetical protein
LHQFHPNARIVESLAKAVIGYRGFDLREETASLRSVWQSLGRRIHANSAQAGEGAGYGLLFRRAIKPRAERTRCVRSAFAYGIVDDSRRDVERRTLWLK